MSVHNGRKSFDEINNQSSLKSFASFSAKKSVYVLLKIPIELPTKDDMKCEKWEVSSE